MNYTLHQLQIFLKITQTKSITRAAEELYLTQPAVSIQLKNFQQQFDIPLTEVVSKKLYITDFGNEIAQAAEKIIREAEEIKIKTHAYKGQLTGTLKISVVSTGKYVMPYFLSQFMHDHPAIELLMDVTNKQRVVESLEKNEVDFALVSITPDKLNVNKLDLLENKLYLVGNRETSAVQKQNTSELFNNLPLILRENGSGTRQTMEMFLNKHNIKVSRKMELTTNEAVKQAVIAGLGYSIMPLIGIRNEVKNKQLRIIEVKGLPIKTHWQLIWMKEKKLLPASQAFLQYIKQHKQEILDMYFKEKK